MSGVSTSLSIQDKFSNTINKARSGVDRMIKSMVDLDTKSTKSSPSAPFKTTVTAIDQSNQKMDQMIKKQKQLTNETKKTSNLWDGIKSKLGAVVAGFGAMGILKLSDSMTTTRARLDLMNDGLQTSAELQDKIMASSNRSRASYQTTADAVAKMGIMAKDAFSSNDEIIAFSELINKQFTIAGTSAAGVDAAMLQLTQAMASGVLRGEELNSIFEQAPTIIQTIADYLDVPIGQIRNMAAEGQITSTIVKNAMLSSADDINKKFKSMPMTYAQVWTTVQNMLLQTFEPLIQAIGKGAQFIYNNWSKIEPVFWGLAAGIAAYVIGLGAYNTYMAIANTITNGFWNTLKKNPLILIAFIIAAIVIAIMEWVNSVGGIHIAWLIMCNGVLSAWDWLQIGLVTGIYWVMKMLDLFGLSFRTLGVVVANYMGDMKADTLMIMQDMVNGAISIINSFISALNKIPGVSIDAISEMSFGTTAQLENEAAKQARNSDLAAYKDSIDNQIADRDNKLNAMKADARAASAARSAEIAAKQADKVAKAGKEKDSNPFDQYKGLGGGTDNIGNVGKVGEVGKIKDDVNIADEDLQMMKDVAEMRYVQNYITMTPQMTMNNNISEKADINELVAAMDDYLGNEIAMAAEGDYR